jgi:hypothetical protein
VAEEIGLREASVKHFRKADGSFMAVTYAEPVHFLEANNWIEVDATLKVSGDQLEATSLPYHLQLPQKLGSEEQITLETDGYSIGFGVVQGAESGRRGTAELLNTADVAIAKADAAAAQAKTVQAATPAQKQALAQTSGSKATEKIMPRETIDKNEEIRQENAKFMELTNQDAAVRYPGVFQDADLEYIVTASQLKESIVIQAPGGEYTYQFAMNLGGLHALAQENGSIALADEGGKTVATMEVPYMVDAAGERSDAVVMALTQEDGRDLLTVTADMGWLNEDGRTFPVAVDPTITMARSSFYGVNSGSPNSRQTSAGLPLGRGYTNNNIFRIYAPLSFPSIPANSTITNAAYTMFIYFAFVGAIHPLAYAVNSIPSSWATQVHGTTANSFMAYAVANQCFALDMASPRIMETDSGNVGYYMWDITKQIRDWYQAKKTSGALMICSEDETKSAWSILDNRSGFLPVFVVSYVNNIGLENHWSYESIDLGRSGTIYVNRYNGLMTYVHPDIAEDGNRLPVNISHILTGLRPLSHGNWNDVLFASDMNPYALNWTEYFVSDWNNYQLWDADGTTHYFEKVSGTNTYKCEEFEDLILTKISYNLLTLTDKTGNVKQYKMNESSNVYSLTRLCRTRTATPMRSATITCMMR